MTDPNWTAPDVERRDELFVAAERPMLESWLERHRDTLQWKCAGLTAEQLKMRAAEPSSMSLLGLVRHMADVERSWFRRRMDEQDVPPIFWTMDNQDGDFDDVDTADAEADYATYLAEVDAAREAGSRHGLDETFIHKNFNQELNVRWVYIHMIEEYARHNGHADLLRERIDGATGE